MSAGAWRRRCCARSRPERFPSPPDGRGRLCDRGDHDRWKRRLRRGRTAEGAGAPLGGGGAPCHQCVQRRGEQCGADPFACAGPNSDLHELSNLAAAIIENALGALHVPRRLIDFTRRFTSPGFDQKADPVVLIDLNALLRETAESQRAQGDPNVEWVLNLNPIPKIRGSATQIRSLLGYVIQNAARRCPRVADGSASRRRSIAELGHPGGPRLRIRHDQ